MKWIKCIEKQPDKKGGYYVKLKDAEESKTDAYFNGTSWESYSNQFISEWLDESAKELTPVQGSAEEIIHKGIEFAKTINSDSESYKIGAGFGYSCGYEKAMHEYASSAVASAPQGYSLEDMEKCWDEAILSFSKSIGNDVSEEESESPIFKNFQSFIASLPTPSAGQESGWISVEDGLPDAKKPVLTRLDFIRFATGNYAGASAVKQEEGTVSDAVGEDDLKQSIWEIILGGCQLDSDERKDNQRAIDALYTLFTQSQNK